MKGRQQEGKQKIQNQQGGKNKSRKGIGKKEKAEVSA